MRCNNCGWTNPEGLSKCQKCNQILCEPEPIVAPKEVVETHVKEKYVGRCLKCGYPLDEGADYCPNCGSQKIEIPRKENFAMDSVQNRKTVVLDPSSVVESDELRAVEPNVEQAEQEKKFANQDLSENHNPESAPREGGDGYTSAPINKTVIENPRRSSLPNDTRKTVVDSSDYLSGKKKSSPSAMAYQDNYVDTKVDEYRYKLSCIDGDAAMDVMLQASSELSIKQGEVMLIGGLRYRVD